jgi:hypothetical protein
MHEIQVNEDLVCYKWKSILKCTRIEMSRMTENIIVMCRFRSRSRLWRLSQLSTLFQFYLVCVDSSSHGLWCLGPCGRKLKLGCNGKKIKCFLSKSTLLPEAWNIQGGGISSSFLVINTKCIPIYSYTHMFRGGIN